MGYEGGDGRFEDGPGRWAEYSVGNVPEYASESLWTATEKDGYPEVRVFGPADDQIPAALTTFDEASTVFPPQLIQRLRTAGFTAPTPIQAHTWSIAVEGRDVIGVAKTGSGKTLAFLLPGFLRVLHGRPPPPTICILAPTRELACQIEAEAEKFGRPLGIRTACCYGGAPRGPQLSALRRGVQVVVACPGRLNDFISSAAVRLQNVTYMVLDEADRMLDMGFEPQIRSVIAETSPDRQTLLFTATWPKDVRSLASEFLRKPIHVQTGKNETLTANQDIEQNVIFCTSEAEKTTQLISILQNLQYGDRCLIFCETKRATELLCSTLVSQHRIPAVRIHGDMEQRDRKGALESFRSARSPVLVATDVAARGLDVKGVSVVVNFEAAGTAKDYVHRIGRTGRAGNKGVAYSLLLRSEDRKAQDIVQVMRQNNIPIPPELQEVAGKRSGGKGKGKNRKGGGKGGKGWRSGGGGGGGRDRKGGGGDRKGAGREAGRDMGKGAGGGPAGAGPSLA
uniref:RNA helicase n=1 Tax=Noctiluca scintillans TaxID=2966 RepID=A0A7S1AVP3_NOCSC